MNSKISIIGGGTGISAILKGLKREYSDINAIVNVVDNGGSSGVLRREYGIIPPGDLRSCVLALSNTTPMLEKLFGYRFPNGAIGGHSLGNLIITALSEITGSMENALGEAASIFNINGKVYAVTLENIQLMAKLENGKRVVGEAEIPEEVLRQNSPIRYVNLLPARPKAYKKVIRVIEQSDIIIVGPGSLYTSILPALIVSGIKEAIMRSHAKKIYIANLMQQPGETDGFSARRHVEVIYDHIEDPIFDYVIANNTVLNDEIVERYRALDSHQILVSEEDRAYFSEQGIRCIEGNFIDIWDNRIRHNDKNVVDKIIDIDRSRKIHD